MSGLKSAWELSLEKSDKLVPELKKQAKLTAGQKSRIGEIRKEYRAKIADKDITFQHKIKTLADGVSPEGLELEAEELSKRFAEEKQLLEKEMENKIEEVKQNKK